MNRLKSLFVHKMRNPRDRAPILEVLEAAGVYVREKVEVWRPEVVIPTSSTLTSDVVVIDAIATASRPKPPPTITSTTTTNTSTSTDGKDPSLRSATSTHATESLRSEPSTPAITDKAEWMTHRSEHLMRIKQKKEARRRGGVAGA